MIGNQGQSEPREGVMRLAEVKALTGRSRSSIYEDMAARRFPHSIKLGPRSVGWLRQEVMRWVAERVAARDSASKDRDAT